MLNQLHVLLGRLGRSFWLIPGLMVLAGVASALCLVYVERNGWVPASLLRSAGLYNGGGTGARTLLGAVASSAIGVAGTVFSITIAALSLAAGQMGPRLLRNFTEDRGNQFTLGAFLGTFSYALMVLRSVRTESEGEFVPYLSLSIGILLAFLCVATLVYFVNHMAGRINVDTVIELVSGEMQHAIGQLACEKAPPGERPRLDPATAQLVVESRRGYLLDLDTASLADWAARHHTVLQLLVRPGDYVFPGAPVAACHPPVEDADPRDVIRTALSLSLDRASTEDIEYGVRQLVEVGVRALSPGINDPHTAMSVLDRLGAALCGLAPLHLPNGLYLREGRCVLLVPAVDYDRLAATMFEQMRQNAAAHVMVLKRLLEVLTAVASCERNPSRLSTLQRHVDHVVGDARRTVASPVDLDSLLECANRFKLMCQLGPRALLTSA